MRIGIPFRSFTRLPRVHFPGRGVVYGLRRTDKYLLLRLLGLGVLVFVYYALDWTLLRLGLREVIGFLMGFTGHAAMPVDSGKGIFLVVESGFLFEIGTPCTYVNLFLIAAPFCWRFQRSAADNILRLTILATAVQVFNVLRVLVALHFHLSGISWTLAHDIPDIAIRFVVISISVLLALRSDNDFKLPS